LENPLLLHPEIDEPKQFFECDKTGQIQAKDTENKRAMTTIKILDTSNKQSDSQAKNLYSVLM
jgi:hypothetical protein